MIYNPKGILDIYIADPHTGSSVGAFPCLGILASDDGQLIEPSEEQLILWQFIKEVITDIQKVKRRTGCMVRSVFTGDLVEGLHHNSVQMVTMNLQTMEEIGIEFASQFAHISDEVVVIRGTESHVGASAQMEERIALRLYDRFNGKVRKDRPYRASWPVYEEEVNGTLVNICHHGKVGRTDPSKLSPLIRKAQETLIGRYGKKPVPKIMISAHTHMAADTSDQIDYMRVLQLPCLKMTDMFGHKVAPNSDPCIGIWAIWYKPDGAYVVLKKDFLIDRGNAESQNECFQ